MVDEAGMVYVDVTPGNRPGLRPDASLADTGSS
jgi:hypothetical protein